MANYTIELGRLASGGFDIFGFDYDFYNPDKKKDFEQLFIDRFYNYEICCETPIRWRRYLSTVMKTKFPYYNMLLVTAQIEYEKTKNYNITETQTRDVNNNSVTSGANTVNATINGNDLSHNTSDYNNHVTGTAGKTNELESDTQHNSNDIESRNETLTDDNSVSFTGSKTADNKKVHSDTPKSLLSMDNIKKNVYASDAELLDNNETEKNTNKTTGTKNNNLVDTTTNSTHDAVKGKNTEASNNTSNEYGDNNAVGSITHSETNNTQANNLQNINGKTTENYTRTMSGSYGVITEADMLQKHIALQDKLTHIFDDFFENECIDLFMQIWN